MRLLYGKSYEGNNPIQQAGGILQAEQSQWSKAMARQRQQKERSWLANPVYMAAGATVGAVESVLDAGDTVAEIFGGNLIEPDTVNNFVTSINADFGDYYTQNEGTHRFIGDLALAFTGSGIILSATSRARWAATMFKNGPNSKVAKLFDKYVLHDWDGVAVQAKKINDLVKTQQAVLVHATPAVKQALKQGRKEFAINFAKQAVIAELGVGLTFYGNENIGLQAITENPWLFLGVHSGFALLGDWRYRRGMTRVVNGIINSGASKSLKDVVDITAGFSENKTKSAILNLATLQYIKKLDMKGEVHHANTQAFEDFLTTNATDIVSALADPKNPFSLDMAESAIFKTASSISKDAQTPRNFLNIIRALADEDVDVLALQTPKLGGREPGNALFGKNLNMGGLSRILEKLDQNQANVLKDMMPKKDYEILENWYLSLNDDPKPLAPGTRSLVEDNLPIVQSIKTTNMWHNSDNTVLDANNGITNYPAMFSYSKNKDPRYFKRNVPLPGETNQSSFSIDLIGGNRVVASMEYVQDFSKIEIKVGSTLPERIEIKKGDPFPDQEELEHMRTLILRNQLVKNYAVRQLLHRTLSEWGDTELRTLLNRLTVDGPKKEGTFTGPDHDALITAIMNQRNSAIQPNADIVRAKFLAVFRKFEQASKLDEPTSFIKNRKAVFGEESSFNSPDAVEYLGLPLTSSNFQNSAIIRIFELLAAKTNSDKEIYYLADSVADLVHSISRSKGQSLSDAEKAFMKVFDINAENFTRADSVAIRELTETQTGHDAFTTLFNALNSRSSVGDMNLTEVIIAEKGTSKNVSELVSDFIKRTNAEESLALDSIIDKLSLGGKTFEAWKNLYRSAEFQRINDASTMGVNTGSFLSNFGSKFFNSKMADTLTAAFHFGTTWNTVRGKMINEVTAGLQEKSRHFRLTENRAETRIMMEAYHSLADMQLRTGHGNQLRQVEAFETADGWHLGYMNTDGGPTTYTPIMYQGTNAPITLSTKSKDFILELHKVNQTIFDIYNASAKAMGLPPKNMQKFLMGYSNYQHPFMATIRRSDGSIANVVRGATRAQVNKLAKENVEWLRKNEKMDIQVETHSEITEINDLTPLVGIDMASNLSTRLEMPDKFRSTYGGSLESFAKDAVDDVASVLSAVLSLVHASKVSPMIKQSLSYDQLGGISPKNAKSFSAQMEANLRGTSLVRPTDSILQFKQVNEFVDASANWALNSWAMNKVLNLRRLVPNSDYSDRDKYNQRILDEIDSEGLPKGLYDTPAIKYVLDASPYRDIQNLSGVLNTFASFVYVQTGQMIPALQNITGAVISAPAMVRAGMDSRQGISSFNMGRIMLAAVHDMFRDSTGLLARMEDDGLINNEIIELNKRAGKFKSNLLEKTIGGQPWVGNVNPLTWMVTQSERMSRRLSASVGIQALKRAEPDIGEEALMAFGARVMRESVGVYDATNRMGLFQSGVGMNFSLFTTFAINYYEQLLSNIGAGHIGAVARQQFYQSLLFGTESSPIAANAIALIDITRDDPTDNRNLVDRMNEKYGTDFTNTFIWGGMSTLTGLDLHTPGDVSRLPVTTQLTNLPIYSLFSDAVNTAKAMTEQIQLAGDLSAQETNEIMQQFMSQRYLRSWFRHAAGNITDRSGMTVDQELSGGVEIAALIAGTRTLEQLNQYEVQTRIRGRKASQRQDMMKFSTALRRAIRGKAVTNETMEQAFYEYVKNGGSPSDFRQYIKRIHTTALISKFDQTFLSAVKSGRLDDLIVALSYVDTDELGMFE